MNHVRSRARRLPLLLSFLAMAFVLSGCIHATIDATVSSDDTVSGTVEFALKDEYISILPGGSEEFRKEISADGCDIPGAEVEPYEEAGFTGVKCTFDKVPLADFNGMSGEEGSDTEDLTLTREGDKFILKGTLDLTEEASGGAPVDPSEPDFSEALKDAEVEFKFTFPGKVESTTGVKSNNDRTVTFTPNDEGKADIQATASAIESGSDADITKIVILVAAIVAGVLLVLLALVLLLKKRNKSKNPPQSGYGPPPAGGYTQAPPGSAGYGGYNPTPFPQQPGGYNPQQPGGYPPQPPQQPGPYNPPPPQQ
jgi:hypothetical protein